MKPQPHTNKFLPPMPTRAIVQFDQHSPKRAWISWPEELRMGSRAGRSGALPDTYLPIIAELRYRFAVENLLAVRALLPGQTISRPDALTRWAEWRDTKIANEQSRLKFERGGLSVSILSSLMRDGFVAPRPLSEIIRGDNENPLGNEDKRLTWDAMIEWMARWENDGYDRPTAEMNVLLELFTGKKYSEWLERPDGTLRPEIQYHPQKEPVLLDYRAPGEGPPHIDHTAFSKKISPELEAEYEALKGDLLRLLAEDRIGSMRDTFRHLCRAKWRLCADLAGSNLPGDVQAALKGSDQLLIVRRLIITLTSELHSRRKGVERRTLLDMEHALKALTMGLEPSRPGLSDLGEIDLHFHPGTVMPGESHPSYEPPF